MRNIILAVSMLLFSSAVAAQTPWFSAQMNCVYNAATATCTVANTGNILMFCELRADGQLASGQFVYTFYNNFIPPGQYRYVYVNSAGPGNPFVGASGGGRCRF